VRTVALGLLVMVGLAACGEEEPGLEPASRPDAALVRSLPEPFEPGARQAPGTYVGKVGAAGWVYVGVVVRGKRALVYLLPEKIDSSTGSS
jgi:hypothetical protein